MSNVDAPFGLFYASEAVNAECNTIALSLLHSSEQVTAACECNTMGFDEQSSERYPVKSDLTSGEIRPGLVVVGGGVSMRVYFNFQVRRKAPRLIAF